LREDKKKRRKTTRGRLGDEGLLRDRVAQVIPVTRLTEFIGLS
jgi:hypothetical protein